jgi:hypothetical protein
MGRKRNDRSGHARHMLADEAARVMREQGVKDFLLAKKKAAERLGIHERAALPGNDEIAAALGEQQRLFGGDAYLRRLSKLRKAAHNAMLLFEEFEPRLVGSVLSGMITDNSDVNLHLFTDTPEAVAVLLMERNIPYECCERRVRYPNNRSDAMPAYRFWAEDVAIEGAIFPVAALRQAPTCPVDGRPMRRARLAELARLAQD